MPQFDLNDNNRVAGVEADSLSTSRTKVMPSWYAAHEQYDFMSYQH
jgi:hypothetical protein